MQVDRRTGAQLAPPLLYNVSMGPAAAAAVKVGLCYACLIFVPNTPLLYNFSMEPAASAAVKVGYGLLCHFNVRPVSLILFIPPPT